jgi:tRNA pseudouridine55 synthase
MRRRVDGVLLLDKPVGVSSNVALQRARRLLEAQKAGHTGTLDPLASGLLPICFGEATKFSQVLLDARKRYRATVRFGTATSTADAEGEVIARGRAAFEREAIAAVLARFIGTIAQVPPQHAALKRDGRPYYEYARAGIAIPREPREVVIEALTLIDWSPPDAIVDVTCSKGTYVRVLAEDLGRALGSCAHLAGLRRTGTGGFDVADAVTLEALEALDMAQRVALLLPLDAALDDMPALAIGSDDALALAQGRRPANGAASGRYRGYAPGGFVGLLEATGTELRAIRLRSAAAGLEPGVTP